MLYQLVWQRSLLLLYGSNTESVAMVVSDLDGDGCLDIATADGQGNTVSFLRNRLCD